MLPITSIFLVAYMYTYTTQCPYNFYLPIHIIGDFLYILNYPYLYAPNVLSPRLEAPIFLVISYKLYSIYLFIISCPRCSSRQFFYKSYRPFSTKPLFFLYVFLVYLHNSVFSINLFHFL